MSSKLTFPWQSFFVTLHVVRFYDVIASKGLLSLKGFSDVKNLWRKADILLS